MRRTTIKVELFYYASARCKTPKAIPRDLADVQWYARHGRELVGCKSPVRGRKSEGRQSMTVTPIDKVLADGNCGRVTDRGKEARVQTCGATNRNRIQGRRGQASGPCITKPFSSSREGKCGARARKVHVLIRGDLPDVPGSRAWRESQGRACESNSVSGRSQQKA